ncbi:MAG: helix-turn-helix domain-containing protein [Vicinamibacteria bacterium]
MPVSYGEHDPAPELRGHFSSYWIFRAEAPLPDAFQHSVPPDGAVSVASGPGGPTLVLGPRTEPFRPQVWEGQLLYGARFWPGAAGAVLGDVSRLVNRVLPLVDVLREAEARRWSEALSDRPDDEAAVLQLDALCAPLVERSGPLDQPVIAAVLAIVEAPARTGVSALAAASGLSERQFRRRFVAAVGLTPKEFARVRRLRLSLLDALARREARWGDVAAAGGYADQAHLVREYRRLCGLRPQAFREHLGRIRHGRVTS